jgi:hypothetical protein
VILTAEAENDRASRRGFEAPEAASQRGIEIVATAERRSFPAGNGHRMKRPHVGLVPASTATTATAEPIASGAIQVVDSDTNAGGHLVSQATQRRGSCAS